MVDVHNGLAGRHVAKDLARQLPARQLPYAQQTIMGLVERRKLVRGDPVQRPASARGEDGVVAKAARPCGGRVNVSPNGAAGCPKKLDQVGRRHHLGEGPGYDERPPPAAQKPLDGDLGVLVTEKLGDLVERHLLPPRLQQEGAHGLACPRQVLAGLDDAAKRVGRDVRANRVVLDGADVQDGLAQRHILHYFAGLLVAGRVSDGEQAVARRKQRRHLAGRDGVDKAHRVGVGIGGLPHQLAPGSHDEHAQMRHVTKAPEYIERGRGVAHTRAERPGENDPRAPVAVMRPVVSQARGPDEKRMLNMHEFLQASRVILPHVLFPGDVQHNIRCLQGIALDGEVRLALQLAREARLAKRAGVGELVEDDGCEPHAGVAPGVLSARDDALEGRRARNELVRHEAEPLDRAEIGINQRPVHAAAPKERTRVVDHGASAVRQPPAKRAGRRGDAAVHPRPHTREPR